MTGNITSQYKDKTGENTVIEDVEYDVYEIPDSDISKADAKLFDQIDNGKVSFLPSSKSFELIETLGEGFHSEEMVGQMRKVDPNESGSLDLFIFVRWYVNEEVSLESTEESESFVCWFCKVRLMYLQ